MSNSSHSSEDKFVSHMLKFYYFLSSIYDYLSMVKQLGGVKRGSRKLILVVVPDRRKDTLMKPITRWIKPGTTIYSDSWSSYKDIGKSEWHHLFD